MAELIQQFKEPMKFEGARYLVRVYGEPQRNVWIGWLEFHPVEDTLPILRTEEETSQPDRGALAYWASGLESLYFEGAIQRAHRVAAA